MSRKKSQKRRKNSAKMVQKLHKNVIRHCKLSAHYSNHKHRHPETILFQYITIVFNWTYELKYEEKSLYSLWLTLLFDIDCRVKNTGQEINKAITNQI